MRIGRSTPVAIYIAIFLSLSSRRIEANSENPRIKGDERLTVNLDDLVIEVTAPRGREGILNTEPFYERWQNVDDVAYWESIYGSADNIPEFEDLPEIAGESFELKYAGESENESSNAEDSKTSDIDCAERTMEKKFPPKEVAVSKGRKNLSSDRCERINPLYPARRSSVRQKRETSPTIEESEAVDPKRVTRTLSSLRGESGRSRSKFGLSYHQRPEHYCPCNKHGRSCYRPYGFGHRSSSPCDRPEDDSAVGRTESVRFVDLAINAESVNANTERCNVARVVADAVGNAGGQLAQAKRDAIDLGPVGWQASGLGSVNNAGRDRLEEGVDSGEAHIDGGLYIVGNSVLDTNSGIINADKGTADGIESALDSEMRAAGIDTAVGTPVDNDVDEVKLEVEPVGAKLEEEAAAEAETASEVSTKSKSKLDGEEGLQRETEVTKNSTVIFEETEGGDETRVVSDEDYSKFEKNYDGDQVEVVGANLKENEEGVTEILSNVEKEGPVVVEDEKMGNSEKSGGKETVGSTLSINSDGAVETYHGEEGLQRETEVTKNSSVILKEPEGGDEARVVSDEDYSKFEKNYDGDQVEVVGANLKENEEGVTEIPSNVEKVGPVVVEDERMGNREKSGGEETVGSTLSMNSGGAVESSHGEDASGDHEIEDLSCESRSSSEEDYCYPREFYSRRFYDVRPLHGDGYHEESEENSECGQRFSAAHGHHASTGIHAPPNTGLEVNTYIPAAGVISGPHANSGIQTSLEEDVTLNTDATAGHPFTGGGGSSDVGASPFSVRDENYRNYDEQPVDAASSEYEEYDEEPEYRRRFPENLRGDESFSYHGMKFGIRGDGETRTSLDTEFEINSACAAGGLHVGAKSCPGRESRLDIWPVTLGINGPDRSRLCDVINSVMRADGEIRSSDDSRLDVNADGHSLTGSESSPDLDSHLDIGTEANRATAVKLGEKICESACGGISDSGVEEEADWTDSRSDEAYDGRSEYPVEESFEVDGEGAAAYHTCDNCRRELYGGSCPICGRFGDRPVEERRRYLLAGTIHHFDGPIEATAGPDGTRGTRHLNHDINLDANCTSEAASHSLDCQGMDQDLQTPRDGNPVPLRFVRTHLSHGHDIAVDMHDRARSLVAGGLHPRDHTASMLSFFHSKVPDDLVKLNEESEITLFGTKLLQQQLSVDYNVTPNSFLEFLNNHGFRVTGDGICRGRRKRCGGHDKFRNLDGSCNNFDNPTWGQSNRAFARILPPRYSDGIHGMPVSVTGADLPNPRKLSVRLYSRRSNLDPELTLAVVQWGQTLAHDLARQVMDQTTKGGIECCGENGKSQLPKSLQHHSCAPISISPRDKFYSSHGQRCMNFVRSMTVAREDCTLGPADQLNGATSFLDCSPMYGVDKATSDELREFTGGRMKVEFRSGRWMLPTVRNHSNVCDIWTSDDVCYRSGDPRNNQNPQLVILQTLLVREHNRIADGLSVLNPDWTDERIFQESRRIVIAEYQHITYNEWLPLVLGKRYVRRHGIVRTKPGMSSVYNELVDPSTIIGFTSGAFRSLHSMIEGEIGLCNVEGNFVENLRLSDHYFRPRIIEKGSNFEHLLRGLTAQRMQKQNMHLHTELTEYLFRSCNDYGMDLAAIDIQRGRDHGVPGYNAYRKICRLRPAQDFDDLFEEISWENIEKLRRDYAHVDDIDLIVGATMEKRVTGSQFGPTNRCLIGEQFYRSRMGDRYFYDNERFCRSFTPEQFNEITKVTLSRLICDMGGDVDVVQRYAFRATSSKNPLVPCEDLPKLDLKFWVE